MSDSLDKLRNRILSDARVRAEDILREANEKAEQIRREAREKAEREAREILARAEVEAEAARRSIISSRIRANRMRLLEERNSIVQRVLGTVEDQLSSIGSTGNFQDIVKRLATEAIDAVGSEKPIIKIGFPKASNSKFNLTADVLPKSATIIQDNKLGEEELGGVVATDPEGKIAYRNTFRARLDRRDRELLALISSTIFGEFQSSPPKEVETGPTPA
ncbi:MAG TPA: V-type ATP synthase subunit E family protein [Candidatus Binatus sp.]|nr:V-type ATP synthase subunit E family protein [Candidatus Binatus sp.]